MSDRSIARTLSWRLTGDYDGDIRCRGCDCSLVEDRWDFDIDELTVAVAEHLPTCPAA